MTAAFARYADAMRASQAAEWAVTEAASVAGISGLNPGASALLLYIADAGRTTRSQAVRDMPWLSTIVYPLTNLISRGLVEIETGVRNDVIKPSASGAKCADRMRRHLGGEVA